MAVAVKTMPDSTTQPSSSGLFVPSLMGAVYVVAALAVVFAGVPAVWANGADQFVRKLGLGSFVSTAGLLVVELFAIAVLFMLGLTLTGGRPAKGLKAGIFTIVAGAILTLLIVSGIANAWHGPVGSAVAVGIGAVLVAVMVRTLSARGFSETMQAFDHQGWFTAASYKLNQGRKVRRATLLGLLVLAGAGVYTLLNHHALATMGKNLSVTLPFIGRELVLLPDVKMTLPILLAAASLWLSYRLINVPTFAEFLISTESELNKVAWPTRRSLMQDTIVVLSTVVLMTVFLFVVDVAWGKILSNPYVGVLRFDTTKAAQEAKETPELDW